MVACFNQRTFSVQGFKGNALWLSDRHEIASVLIKQDRGKAIVRSFCTLPSSTILNVNYGVHIPDTRAVPPEAIPEAEVN